MLSLSLSLQQIRETNPACQFVCRRNVPVVHGVSALSVQHRSDLARIHVLSTHGKYMATNNWFATDGGLGPVFHGMGNG